MSDQQNPYLESTAVLMNQGSALSESVARVIAVLGVFVGCYQIVDSSVLYFAFGFTPQALWAPWSIQLPLRYLAAAILLVSPLLLLIGSIADLRAYAWGRRLMIVYAWMWLAMCVLYALERIPEVLAGGLSASFTGWQKVQFILSGLGMAVYASILPLVILAFRNVGRVAARTLIRRGFEPVVYSQKTEENRIAADHAEEPSK